MEALDIYPLKITRDLVLLRFSGCSRSPAAVRPLFEVLQRRGAAVLLLVEGGGAGPARSLSVVVSGGDFERFQDDVEVLGHMMEAQAVDVEQPVVLIRILGPHFDIRPGVAGHLFGHLGRAGIDLLAGSTTITSSLLVIRHDQADQTVRLLQSIFRLPKSR